MGVVSKRGMRLAHLSDLHLLSLAGARFLDFANKRWIGGLNLLANRGRHYRTEIFEAMIEDLNRQKVDHILVTGDVTNLALDEEFRFARELFDRLQYTPEQITVLPGNHDAYVAAGAEFFQKHFAPFFTSDAEFGRSEPWPLLRRRGSVVIVGLSTSLQTPWFTAYGVIGDEQLRSLDEILGSDALDDCFRLLAIHHPPAGHKAESRIRGLRDRQALGDVLERQGVELVLHGHEHLDLREELPGPTGPISVRGIPSATYDAGEASAARRRARYRIYQISDSCLGEERPKVLSEALRIWNPERQAFFEENSRAAAESPASEAQVVEK